ncbi:MAG: cupin domain-containing protein [Pseudomonadota bacterium]
MKTLDFRSLVHFSPDKMQKIEIFSTPLLVADLHCFEPGQAQRSHKLLTSDTVYFVLEGNGRFSVGRTTRECKSGAAVLAPAGEEHGVVNMAEERLVLLVLTTPPAPKT